jgi:hypothetical protein
MTPISDQTSPWPMRPEKLRRLPGCRPSRSPRDVVPMTPCSGLLPINIEHAYEMSTSELHLNQNHVGGQSCWPRTEVCTRRDFRPVSLALDAITLDLAVKRWAGNSKRDG